MGDLLVIRKALTAACAETREGAETDAIGGEVVTSASGLAGAADVGLGTLEVEAGDQADAGDAGVGTHRAEAAGHADAGDAGVATHGVDLGDHADAGVGTRGAGGGIVPAFVVAPGSTDEAAAVMRVAAEHELAVVVRGAGSRLGWGAPPAQCDLLIDMSRMNEVLEHSPGDLVARIQAGARMGDVAAALAREGQEIALDVPGEATVGGVVATGLAGPRRLRYGTPRDLLIGITIVRADGTVARSGGKVVKNVAGYDLGKLLAGSAGTLALITEATFRLHPLPAARAYVTAEYVAAGVACDAVAAAANSPLVASAVELSRPEPGGPIRIGVLIEGSPDGVAARAMRMAGLLGPAETSLTPPPWWHRAPETDGGTLARVSFWVSALPRVLDAIDAAARDAGVSPVVHGSAGAGVLYLRLGPDAAGETDVGSAAVFAADPPGVSTADFVRALRSGLAGERGGVVVLAAPQAVREALAGAGGMAGSVPSLALMRAVKDQFDPGHRLAPGRFPDVV
jgi:glycolate oxidase FAD binding subunit